MKSAAEIQKGFSDLFDPEDISFRPGGTSKDKRTAVVLAYITARGVMERLDEVVGVDGWQTEYIPQAKGSIECRLRVRIGNEWITKADVGNPSEQPDAGDQLKAAYSDALKRAAVQFGIGRYLYKLKNMWHEFDADRRKFASVPMLPLWAIPERSRQPAKLAKVKAIEAFLAQLSAHHKIDPVRARKERLAAWEVADFIDLGADSLATLMQQLHDAVTRAGIQQPK